MKNLMKKIEKEYPSIIKINSSLIRNNKLILVEDYYGKKWIIKIFKERNKMLRNLYVQSYLSENSLSPKILSTKGGNLFFEVGDSYLFVEEYLSQDLNVDTLNYKSIKIKTDILYRYLSKIKIAPKNISKSINNINDREFISYKREINFLWDKLGKKDDSYKTKYIQVIHGDLRPDNILFYQNNLYFIDFEYLKMGNPEVEQLKMLLLLFFKDKSKKKDISKCNFMFNRNIFAQLAFEIKNNTYLAKNWTNINLDYRRQVIQEHIFIMNCIANQFRR